jgi:hypothetical protein
VLLRRSVFAGGLRYDPAAAHCEDWALWVAMAERARLANVPEVLLRYRAHPGQVCAVHQRTQRQNLELIFRRLLARMDIVPTAEELQVHYRLAFDDMLPTPEFRAAAAAWLEKIERANALTGALPHHALVQILASRRRSAFGVQPSG